MLEEIKIGKGVKKEKKLEEEKCQRKKFLLN